MTFGAAALLVTLALPSPPEPRQPVLARLEGSWSGEGTWQGGPARATLQVAPALGARFTRLSYRVDAPVGFEGLAYYSRDSEGRLKGSWFDSQGATHAIETREQDEALEANWGPQGTPKGRTTYRLLEANRLEVVDEIKTRDGSYREFARMTYQRGEASER